MRKLTGLLFVAMVIFLPPIALYNSSFEGFESGWKNGFTRFLIFTYLVFTFIIALAITYRVVRIIRLQKTAK